eukprot:scaffold3882_cov164-Amphora_coffeaeformis.AAC.19
MKHFILSLFISLFFVIHRNHVTTAFGPRHELRHVTWKRAASVPPPPSPPPVDARGTAARHTTATRLPTRQSRRFTTFLFLALSPDKNATAILNRQPQKKKRGYQFGDLTRNAVAILASNNNNNNGDDGAEEYKYQFGDVSRYIDGRIKERINTLTGKESYQWGDLTSWATQRAQNATQTFTGKDTYEVGDITKQVLLRVYAGEYALEDVWLACRILLSAGLGTFGPFASLLPFRTVLQLVNVGLAQEVSGKLLEALAGVLDRRVKQALTGKADYQLGDLTKERLESAITKWTGKESYQLGDIAQTVRNLANANNKKQQTQTQQTNNAPSFSPSSASMISIEEKSLQELDTWDAKFLEHESRETKTG